MERVLENIIKVTLITKLFIWAILTIIGAFIMALPGLFGQSKNSTVQTNLLAEDPYDTRDGDTANIHALRYL